MCRPEVVCAYPISPQTHIIEAVGRKVKSGELAPCEFINVESEFAAMSVSIGASAAGARAYTATASQGLLFMIEAVFNAAGLGLPIVMTLANRAIGAPINIWNDHSDAMAVRDSGWVQLFAETNQDAADLHIQAFRLAEEVSLPVMVCMDGYVLTHAVERVDLPGQQEVDSFLPPYVPRQVLEAAKIDGCSELSIAARIKLPLIRRTVVFIVILSIIGTLQLFNEPMILNDIANIGSSYTPNQMIYNTAFSFGNEQLAAAQSVVLAVITVVATVAFYTIVRRRIDPFAASKEGA